MKSSLSRATPLLAALAAVAWLAPIQARAQEVQAGDLAVTGHVIDEESGEALQYVVVGIPELRVWALSEEDGSFAMTGVSEGIFRFIALKRGYDMIDLTVAFTGPGPVQVEISMDAQDVPDPAGPGRFVGRVSDEATGRAVQGATVSVYPTDQTASTDRQGRFSISGISPGALLVTTEALGYETRSDTLAAFPGTTLELGITLSADPIELPPVVVTARNRTLEAAGFYRRADRGSGTQLDRQAIEERRPVYLSDVLRTGVMGVRVDRGRFGDPVVQSTRGRGCNLKVWLDGMHMPGFNIDTYPVEIVEAVEVYTGPAQPLEYEDSCGSLLIWTRRF